MTKIPLYYTFGNHMHWVDMQWLWGYHVLPGSIRDMLHFCRETGAKGNVNFDGIGYEKLAAEDPEALAELREAVQNGTIEPVGCSYGQPYGLFHGGESNIRQRIYGARTVRRLLGVWPKTFWEEEFDFFPQLPQMLKGCGFDYASLFFQWTWHTPEIPKEEVPVIWWEGQDGSKLLCATRNKLNLHQWPEDMDATFADLASSPPTPDAQGPTPLILQWLELMPSPDWMCRSELLLPKMRELLADDRFDIEMATLGEYLKRSMERRSIGFQPMPMSAFQADSPDHQPDNFIPDQERELTIRQGAKLPHWTRDRAIYHVTFRLADSVPKQVQEEWSAERRRLDRLIEENRLTDKEKFEYQRLHTEKIEDYLDSGHGNCLLSNPVSADIVAQALQHFDQDRYLLWAWAVMPNHVHAIVEPLSHELADIVHSWKSFTSNKINEALSREGTVWQREYYDHIIRNSVSMSRATKYVEDNPTKAGLVNWTWAKNNWVQEEGDRRQDAFEKHRLEADATTTVPTRNYSMDDVWHGMTLGKNADNMRRDSFRAESELLATESLATILSLFGRPYAQWDVYPTWELEEQWRNLLMAQHHDNDECEGLCGHVGKAQYGQAISESIGLMDRLTDLVDRDFNTPGDVIWVYNPLGWSRKWHVVHRSKFLTVVDVPAFGWTSVPMDAPDVDCGGWIIDGNVARFRRGSVEIDFDLESVTVTHFANSAFPGGIPLSGKPLWNWTGTDHKGNQILLKGRREWWDREGGAPDLVGERMIRLPVQFEGHDDFGFTIQLACEPHHESLEIRIVGTASRPKAGLNPAFGFTIPISATWSDIISDEPYGVSAKKPTGSFHKKYPEGDWMTSPQWFEKIDCPFTANTFVDLQHPESQNGLQITHDGTRQWFVEADGSVRHILHAYDPWDEDRDSGYMDNHFRFTPHTRQSKSQLWRAAQEAHRDCQEEGLDAPGARLPSNFSALSCDSPNVIPTAFYRETEDFSGKHVENYAGKGMGYPFVIRLVEFDGLETETTLTVAGTVAKAYKTNHLGQVLEEITDGLKVKMRPYEIATIYLDIVEGRKQTRDLDAKREIWATVHRVDP